MPKKDKQNAQPETPEKEPQAAAAEEKELPPEDKKEEAKAETFTVMREQMEKMEGLAKSLADEQDNLEAIKKKYKSIQKKIANSEKYSSELEDQMAELDGKQLDTQHSLDLQETAINEGKDDFMERIRAKVVNIVIYDPCDESCKAR